MLNCPHCGKADDVTGSREVSWYQYDPGRGVSLGCGTLILIAIIVAIFSNSGTGVKAGAIRELQMKIQTLENKIDKLIEKQK